MKACRRPDSGCSAAASGSRQCEPAATSKPSPSTPATAVFSNGCVQKSAMSPKSACALSAGLRRAPSAPRMWRRLSRILPHSTEQRRAFVLGGLAAAAVASPLFVMAYRTFARSQAGLVDSLVGEP